MLLQLVLSVPFITGRSSCHQIWYIFAGRSFPLKYHTLAIESTAGLSYVHYSSIMLTRFTGAICWSYFAWLFLRQSYVSCRGGHVNELTLNAKFYCDLSQRSVYRVSSEMQCVHECAKTRNCEFLNYRISDDGTDNCEIFRLPPSHKSCKMAKDETHWKALVFEVIIILIITINCHILHKWPSISLSLHYRFICFADNEACIPLSYQDMLQFLLHRHYRLQNCLFLLSRRIEDVANGHEIISHNAREIFRQMSPFIL